MKSTPRNLIAMQKLDSVSPRLVWLGHSFSSWRRHIGGNGYFGRLADKSVRPTQAVTETFDVSRGQKAGQTAAGQNGRCRLDEARGTGNYCGGLALAVSLPRSNSCTIVLSMRSPV